MTADRHAHGGYVTVDSIILPGRPRCFRLGGLHLRRLRLRPRDPELLLQARRGGRVLEHKPLAREAVLVRLLRHQGALVKARENELELARVPVDVADRENAGHVGLERAGVDRNELAVLHGDAPVGDRPELHGEPEEGQQRIAGNLEVRAVVALDDRPLDHTARTLQLRDLAEHEVDLPLAYERHHLVDAVGRSAELVATMQQREVTRDRREVERPVERAVAATDDEQALAAKLLHLAHRVEHGFLFKGLDAGNGRALGLERAAAGGDHHHLAFELLAGVGLHAEQRVADLLDALDHLLQMELGAERLDLREQALDQALPGAEGNAGDVVDRLLRIELGALAADLVEDVDEVRLHVEEAKLEHCEQAARPRSDDEHVGLDRLHHASSASRINAPVFQGKAAG